MATKTDASLKTYPKVYDIVRRLPVARFYYQGNHSHPIRRTVVIIEETKDLIRGYELREGNSVRSLQDVLKTIKSYRKDRIAKWGDYSRLRQSSKNYLKPPEKTTLERSPIVSLFKEGA